MPWDRWEEQSVYFCEVVCRDVLLPAVASHNIAASSTQGIYGSRARLCPLGSGAPTRCHTDPPLQDVLMTPHFLSPHSSRGSPEVGPAPSAAAPSCPGGQRTKKNWNCLETERGEEKGWVKEKWKWQRDKVDWWVEGEGGAVRDTWSTVSFLADGQSQN